VAPLIVAVAGGFILGLRRRRKSRGARRASGEIAVSDT
jgi:hypothetical protein